MSAHETLGLLLVREGLITRPQLYDALRLQRQTGRLLGTCLLSLGYLSPEALLAMLSRQLSIPALPPGTLNRASPEAFRRVPRDVAFRLRILPYSWDGQMLGVAISDGRVLGQLHEVAYHARAAIGAYVALETEIEAVLRTIYGAAETEAARISPTVDERPRPPRAAPRAGRPTAPPDAAASPSRSPRFDRAPSPPPTHTAPLPEVVPASGIAEEPQESRIEPPAKRGPVTGAACQTLERLSFFEAIERLYEADSIAEIGRMAGRALLNYFQRTLVVGGGEHLFRVVGCAGLELARFEVPEGALPLVTARLGERQFAYGYAAMDVRVAELAGLFGFEPGATALVATIGDAWPLLVVFADNGPTADLYDDLHDIELLFKEAETGLAMLRDRS